MKKITNSKLIVGIYMVLTIVSGLLTIGLAVLFLPNMDIYGVFIIGALAASLVIIISCMIEDVINTKTNK